jgi:2-oxoisovalerate dehydrogenase E1 component alpha subunit
MSNGQTRFHVPTPPYRPGDEPDFAHLDLQKAGEAPRPDPAASWQETRDLATGLVGVLDHNHQAVGDVESRAQPGSAARGPEPYGAHPDL